MKVSFVSETVACKASEMQMFIKYKNLMPETHVTYNTCIKII